MKTSPLKKWRIDPDSLMTSLFIAICVIVYLLMLVSFGSTERIDALLTYGAKSNELINGYGQWWRLITASFVHIGIQHLILNMISLYFLGLELEKIMGAWRYSLLFLVACLGGNLFSYAFNDSISAGASTGIFGLFASYLVLAKMYPRSTGLQMRAYNYSVLIVLNVINGLLSPGIDNWGHIGGAIYGAAICLILGLKGVKPYGIDRKTQFLAGLFLLLLSGVLVFFGHR